MGDGGVPLQDLFHVFFTVSAAGKMVVLHCKTYLMILLQFQKLGDDGVTLQDNISCFLYSFSSWGDDGVTLQDNNLCLMLQF